MKLTVEFADEARDWPNKAIKVGDRHRCERKPNPVCLKSIQGIYDFKAHLFCGIDPYSEDASELILGGIAHHTVAGVTPVVSW